MREQENMQATTKRHRSRQTSKQNGIQLTFLPSPVNDDKKAWETYWEKQGQPWRTEPEIDTERQKYLDERRSITPDIRQGIYPFKDIKLSRADVEWLLATHESGRGPVKLDDNTSERGSMRRGIDIRGADLRGVDLRYLPLTNVIGSLNYTARKTATEEERNMAAVHLEGANLALAQLEYAKLHDAHLENANLDRTHLELANLRGAYFDGARCHFSYFQGAYFKDASLKGADFKDAFLERARFVNVVLSDEEGTGPLLADAHWEGVNLALVKWPQKNMLGDEHKARQKMENGTLKDKAVRLYEYERAVRANRQLAVALQTQGLDEVGARFVYRAQSLQRKVFWYQRKLGQYLFSLLLDLLAGYGYRPGRSFIAYAFVITVFATIYHLLGTHLSWNEAIVISMTAFHGRGFFPDQFHPGDPQALVAAIEAFVGLLIEVTFIATLTQRLFRK